jgi:hypothetical protein
MKILIIGVNVTKSLNFNIDFPSTMLKFLNEMTPIARIVTLGYEVGGI